jgi:hypothetical protein
MDSGARSQGRPYEVVGPPVSMTQAWGLTLVLGVAVAPPAGGRP